MDLEEGHVETRIVQATDLADKRLVKQAIEAGAVAAKVVKAADIVVAQWVRHKCQSGCPDFGKNFMCPPYSPTHRETVEVLRGYQQALLIEFRSRHMEKGEDEAGRTHIHQALYNLERSAFLDGYYRAISYGWGHCRLCPECPAAKLENPSMLHMKGCLNPRMARPSMEAAGIDVYGTVRNAGWELRVVPDKSGAFTTFGLVLLE